MHGLEVIEKARDWYFKQIGMIQEKIRFIGRNSTYCADYSIDAYQERLNFQATRILTVNQHLSALIDTDRGFPMHMNLALRPVMSSSNSQTMVANPNVVNRLKEQNRLLTDEVSKKCDRISQLEREKTTLLHEVFQSRNQTPNKLPVESSFC